MSPALICSWMVDRPCLCDGPCDGSFACWVMGRWQGRSSSACIWIYRGAVRADGTLNDDRMNVKRRWGFIFGIEVSLALATIHREKTVFT